MNDPQLSEIQVKTFVAASFLKNENLASFDNQPFLSLKPNMWTFQRVQLPFYNFCYHLLSQLYSVFLIFVAYAEFVVII